VRRGDEELMDRPAALIPGIAAMVALLAGALAPAAARAQALALRGDVPAADAQPAAALSGDQGPADRAEAPSVAAPATPRSDGALVPSDPFASPFAEDPFANTASDPFALPAQAPSAAPLATAPGTLPPSPNTPAASAPVGGPVPPRRKKRPEEDPWAPTGVRIGTVVLRPAVDISGGYESNPAGVRGGSGSSYTSVEAALDVASDWARNAFTASLRGGYTRYFEHSELDTPNASGNAALALDLGHHLTADLALRGALTTQSSYSPDVPANVVGQPQVYSFGGTVGATWKPNRLSVTVEGLADRFLYQDLRLDNGTTVSSADQNYTAYEVRLRTGYDVTPDLTPFVQVSVNRHQRDVTVDRSGYRHSSSGLGGAVGLRWAVDDLLTAEGDVGYQVQRPDDHRLPDLAGPVFDASLAYKLSALTTVTFKGSSSIDETTLPGSPGALQYTGRLQVDQALERWLILTGTVAFQRTDYTGVALTQDLYTAALAVEWRLSRDLALRARIAHNRLISSLPGESYSDEVAEVGVRLRR